MDKKFITSMVLTSLMAGMSSMAMANNAPEEALPTYDLDATVVTATKSSEKLASIPASVSVVTAKDIKEHNYQTVADAIQSLPGVFLDQKGQAGMGGNIYIRGYDAKEILVLLDGMPMNRTYNNDVAWELIPMNNIDKIEVVKGSSSSLYGGRAVGAIVQIFTKKDKQLEPGEVVTTASLKYGSNNTWDKKVYVEGQVSKKLSIGAGYQQRQSDGYKSYYRAIKPSTTAKNNPLDYIGKLPQTLDGKYIIGTRGDKGYDTKNVSVNLRYDFTDYQHLQYNYWHTENKYFYHNPKSFIYDNGKELFKGDVQVAKKGYISFSPEDFLGYEGFLASNTHVLNYNDSKNLVNATIGIHEESVAGFTGANEVQSVDDNGSGSVSSYPGKTFNFDVNKTWEKDNQKILVGASYKEEKMDQYRRELKHWRDKDSFDTSLYNSGITAIYKGKSKNTAIYAQDEIKVSNPTTVYVGLRYDKYTKADGYTSNYDLEDKTGRALSYPSQSYTQISPKLAIEYAANDKTHYYASYGHSFNPPALFQVFRDGGGSMGNVIANPQLKPERTDTWELGMKKQVDKNTDFNLSLFQAKTKDKIFYNKIMGKVPNKPKPQVLYKQYINGNKEDRKGLELELNHKFNKNLSSYFNYTWEIGKVDAGKGTDIDYAIPKHIVHTGLKYKEGKFDTIMDMQYVSARQSQGTPTGLYGSKDPYFLVDTVFNYKFTQDLTAQFAVHNLFNKTIYSDEATSGRTLTFGLNYNF